MYCPRCETTVLDERVRDGVVIDACPRCRGIWLDRGELERLISVAVDDFEGRGPARGRPERGRPERDIPDRDVDDLFDMDGDRDDDDHDDRRGRRGRRADNADGRPRRREGWLESLTDIFD